MDKSTVKVQLPPAAILPPVIVKTGMPPTEVVKKLDPAPQEPAAGKAVIILPEIKEPNASVKFRSVNASVGLVLVIVNSIVVVPPEGIGLVKKVLVNSGVF